MTDQRQTYRTDSTLASCAALVALLQLARTSSEEFSFGPTSWQAIEQQGITVSGTDITAAKHTLAAIPGVVEVDS